MTDLPQPQPQPRRWTPSPVLHASLWLHVAAAACLLGVAIHAVLDGGLTAASSTVLVLAVATLALNHLALTAAGLCPRCSLLGPNITRLPEAASRQGMIAITIDDGPDPQVTPVVLDLLLDAGARASFFLIARQAQRHPELVARIVDEGHSVENHSWAHSHSFSFSGPRRFHREIDRAQQSLARLAGRPPLFFRAPAGMRNPLLEPVLCRLGLPLTSWTRRGFDTVTPDPARVLARLAGKHGERLAAGDILLLHDGNAALAADGRPVILSVLPMLLAACARRRLRPVSLRQAMTAGPATTGEPPRLERHLLDAATERYRSAGTFAYHFARGKLSGDPAFGAIVHNGWIQPGSRVLDLGCGQGLLASLLLAADHGCQVRGIELMPKDARRAQAALGDSADIVCGDICREEFGQVDVAVILDVLHYIDYAAQDHVLQRLRRALGPGGLLLLRVGDAAAGWRFRLSNWVDHAVTFTRGHRLVGLHCRTLVDWRKTLELLGFEVEVIPLSHGTPFANVLLKARLRRC